MPAVARVSTGQCKSSLCHIQCVAKHGDLADLEGVGGTLEVPIRLFVLIPEKGCLYMNRPFLLIEDRHHVLKFSTRKQEMTFKW